MLHINFFDDPSKAPRAREDVRFNQLAVYVHPDSSRRLAVGFDITPFIERPSVEVRAINAQGELAGTLTVIQSNESNFHLTLHLRDKQPTDIYQITATLYYTPPIDGDLSRMEVDAKTVAVDVSKRGTQVSVT